MRVGNGIGPCTSECVRLAVSTISRALWSRTAWSYASIRIRMTSCDPDTACLPHQKIRQPRNRGNLTSSSFPVPSVGRGREQDRWTTKDRQPQIKNLGLGKNFDYCSPSRKLLSPPAAPIPPNLPMPDWPPGAPISPIPPIPDEPSNLRGPPKGPSAVLSG